VLRDNAGVALGLGVISATWFIGHRIGVLERALAAERELRAKDVEVARAEGARDVAAVEAKLERSFLRYTFTEDYKKWQNEVETAKASRNKARE
jgi:hypothetical protein